MSDLFASICTMETALSGAEFSACGAYRTRLWRRWSDGPLLGFGLLNPSKAGVVDNDPTVARIIVRAQRLGFGGLELWNAFSLVSTDPRELRKAADPIGPDNDDAIVRIARRVEMMIVGWGVHATYMNRDRAVLALLRGIGVQPYALRVSKGGHPCHPLYLPYELTPQPFAPKLHPDGTPDCQAERRG